MNNIILIGYRCTGKTTIGKEIAKKLRFTFTDTDQQIEKYTDMTITQYITKYDWKEFKKIEKNIIIKTTKQKDSVICTGGGAVIDNDNIKYLKKDNIVFWLTAKPDTILKRIKADPITKTLRPSLNKNKEINLAEIKKTLKERINNYKKTSDYIINTDNITKKEITEKILNIYNKQLQFNKQTYQSNPSHSPFSSDDQIKTN